MGRTYINSPKEQTLLYKSIPITDMFILMLICRTVSMQ